MRIHSIQDTLQKSDIISRLQQNMQDPARAAAAQGTEDSLDRTRLAQEQPQEVSEPESKIIEDGRRGQTFAGRRRRREPEDQEGEGEDSPSSRSGGSIDVRA